MLVFESSDAEADREEFLARGLPPWDKFYFERKAKLPDGSQVPVAFSLAFATDPRMPEAPEHDDLLRDDLRGHTCGYVDPERASRARASTVPHAATSSTRNSRRSEISWSVKPSP